MEIAKWFDILATPKRTMPPISRKVSGPSSGPRHKNSRQLCVPAQRSTRRMEHLMPVGSFHYNVHFRAQLERNCCMLAAGIQRCSPRWANRQTGGNRAPPRNRFAGRSSLRPANERADRHRNSGSADVQDRSDADLKKAITDERS